MFNQLKRPTNLVKTERHVNSSKKVWKLKFDWRFLSCYQLIFLAFGIIGKPCYSSLQWCAICYDYAIWGCAAHLNMGVGVKWNVPKCIAIVIYPKNSWVRFDPEKGPMWARPIPGSDWSGIRVKMTGIWVQNVFLTRIPGRSDPKMGLAPLGLFSGSNLTREFLDRAFQWYQMQGKWVGNKRENRQSNLSFRTFFEEFISKNIWVWMKH